LLLPLRYFLRDFVLSHFFASGLLTSSN